MYWRTQKWLTVGLAAAVVLFCTLAPAEAQGIRGNQKTSEVRRATSFMNRTEKRLLEQWIKAERAAWVQSNFITQDTEAIAAEAQAELIAATMELAGLAREYRYIDHPPSLVRKFHLLKTTLPLLAPSKASERQELTRISSSMEALYGRGRYCSDARDGECLDLGGMTRIFAESRDYDELLDLWTGWRTIAPPMRPMYERFVELANAGAEEMNFDDMGTLWRSGYDMPPERFAKEVDRLWEQVRPLYEALHCHVRAKLAETYGKKRVGREDPIPAHLLGNMWGQSWGNVYGLVAPEDADTGYDLNELIEANGMDAREMVRYGERFFTSLGFEPLPETFWERSLFTKPEDRDVVCHASAWDLDYVDDLRIKMCIEPTAEDFVTIHHELGHNFYQREYSKQPPLFRNSANDGFHEGIGDTIALSVTPEYLVQIDLLDEVPEGGSDIGLLLRMALDKVAFLPFGLLIDQWRWKVFSGEIPPESYNTEWWALREKYQGIRAPVERAGADFDPGAKYHVPANVPYTRYFLAHILQFQFHRALCDAAGFEGPLHRCSIYGNEAAGKKLRNMLALGSSQPWPLALSSMTGEEKMDATAILEYFTPLQEWLDEQNKGRTCGW